MSTILIFFIIIILVHMLCALRKEQENGIYRKGNIMIGGLFPVHEEGLSDSCGIKINPDRGIQRLEAMRFAVKSINDNPDILRGVTLGVHILDTCSGGTHGLDQALSFVKSILDTGCGEEESDETHNNDIVAVIGAAYSKVSIQIAHLLRLFEIPQISYASTSAELSDKDKFTYFMRTVPPDKLQANALVDIVEHLNWTFVSTVASSGEYGVSGIEAFEKEYLKSLGQCLAAKEKVPQNPTEQDFLNIVDNLYKARLTGHGRVVVLFTGQEDAGGILRAATTRQYYDDFIWVASDGWGNSVKTVKDSKDAARGALTLTLKSNPITEFDSYFTQLTPDNNRENVWFHDYWESFFDCTLPYNESQHFPHKHLYTTTTYNSLPCGEQHGHQIEQFNQEAKIQFVYDAVYAVAIALDKIYREICGESASKLCDELTFNNTFRQRLMDRIKQHDKEDPYGNAIRFDKNGDSLGFYSIKNFRKNSETGLYEYATVGSWENSVLDLDTSIIQWPEPHLPGGKVPVSICSFECGPGERKEVTDEKSCCWRCIACENHEYLEDEETCQPCEIGWWPHENKTGCVQLELQYVKWNSLFAIIPTMLSIIGLIITTFTLIVFIKNVETPVVKAAGRELSFMLLSGCAISYIGVFVLLIKPDTISCIMQRLFLGAGFSIIYASLLTKTNRIYRIFNSALKTTQRPAYISPQSQVVIASLLASLQIAVFIGWIVLEPPGAKTVIPDQNNRNIVVLKCKCEESSLLISLTYNMLLIIICTIYAVLTRKIPSSFNESKFIGFTMYTTCIIWLSFCPVYFGLKSNYRIQVTTLCSAIILSASVALVCLFGPKVHIILFHPHKNRRKTTTDRQRFSYSTTKHHHRGENDSIAVSPSRSRAPSFTSSYHSPANNGTSVKKASFDVKDATIPEEMSSLITPEETSSGVHVNSNDEMNVRSNNTGESTLSPTRSNKISLHRHNSSREGNSCDKPPDKVISNTSSCSIKDLTSLQTDQHDPLDITELKESSVGSTQSLCLAVEKITSEWDFIDSGSTASKGDPSPSPMGRSITGANGDSGIAIHHHDDEEHSKHKSSNWGKQTPPEEVEVPERLI